MQHVFVETNWVVGLLAPGPHSLPAARSLLEQAKAGRIELHLPAFCIAEARGAMKRFHPTKDTKLLRAFIGTREGDGQLPSGDAGVVRRVLELYERQMRADLDALDERLEGLRTAPGLEVFPLSEAIISLNYELVNMDFKLEPVDRLVLASVLTRAKELGSEHQLYFCETDGALLPWDRHSSKPRQPLKKLYDELGIWVYGDFSATTPERPEGWPAGKDPG